jgi:hypothetical protein
MFSNWTRKISGVAALAVTIIAGFTVAQWMRQPNAPSLAEWASYLKELAITYGIIAGVAAVKSIGTDAVAGLKAKGDTVPKPVE